jgi:hypothetical protein
LATAPTSGFASGGDTVRSYQAKRSTERGETSKKEGRMKKRQTMGKMMRDRELRERRALKQQKKDERKLAAVEGGVDGEGNAEDGQGALEDVENDTGAVPSASIPGPEATTT